MSGADGELVAEVDGVFEQAADGEVFAKTAQGQFPAGEFFFPVVLMGERVAVDGFVLATVDGAFGLAVAAEIEFAEGDTAWHGRVEDACGDRAAVSEDVAAEAGVDGDEVHTGRTFPGCGARIPGHPV